MLSTNQIVVGQVLETIPLVMRTLASEFRHAGYTLAPPHFRLLFLLAKRAHNLSELAEKQAVSLPTMSNSVTTMVERGWVKRVRAPHDRRMVVVELTPAGRAVLGDIRCTVEARVTELLASLSPVERDRLSAGLEVLDSAFARAAGDAEQSESG
jgi:DNA-binding MarR family transcriptional regulator